MVRESVTKEVYFSSEDNQSEIHCSKDNTDHAKTKNTDFIYYFVCEPVIAGLITVLKVHMKSNTLTKPLPAEAHWRHMSDLLVHISPEDEGCKELLSVLNYLRSALRKSALALVMLYDGTSTVILCFNQRAF